jgi:hypothetical protein
LGLNAIVPGAGPVAWQVMVKLPLPSTATLVYAPPDVQLPKLTVAA